MNKSYVTVKGLRDLLLSSREFLDRQAEVLPLWIGHGVYVYSLEASCPLVTRGPGAEVTFHIPKQRMGLVKRGSYSTETVTLKNIVVLPPINVTVTENKHFVMVNAQAADLLRSQDCITRDNRQGIQDFYSLDLVLEFAEIAHPMNWTLENYYECTGPTSDAVQQETGSKNNEKVETSANNTVTGTLTEENNAIQSNAEYPLSSGADPSRSDNITSALNKATEDDFKEGSVEDLDISGSGDDKDKSSEQISATEMTELGNLTLNITNGSWTLVTKQPGPPERLQDKHGEISNVPLSNSTVTEESKKLRSTNVTSTLATTTCSLEIGGKHKTSNMESSEEARRTVVHSFVIGDGGSEASSAVVKQKDTINPRNSQQVSSKQSPSEKRAKDDADLWEVLIGDTLMELLDETTRDGFLSPMYRHRASSRRDTGSLEKAKTEKVPEKKTDETSGSSVTPQRRSARDLQHMSEDGVLSSSHIDWRIYGSPHEDLLYNTRSDDIEMIRSAEQLIVEE
ncbi:ciliated left-right organizer ZP-N domains-containing protein [Ranitomeya variabilis]|uniref:ciliated left-right organizer ZP-N domains-containing protein n=1 Tax=Ranitomeya variabilis TaxID=490064 RepID=UPI0040578DA4